MHRPPPPGACPPRRSSPTRPASTLRRRNRSAGGDPADKQRDGGPVSDEDEAQGAGDKTQGAGDKAPDFPYWTQAAKLYRDTWPITIANTLEWYEFGCYAFVSDEIATNFFHGSSIAAWGAFASTFLARPLGGVAFDRLADAYGRRAALLGSAGLMGVATVGQGLAPTIPYAGPASILLCRLAQGLATGGEVGSVAVYVAESAPREMKGMAVQSLRVGGSLGMMLACGVGSGLRTWLGRERMLSFGWRLPFLFAVGPAICAVMSIEALDAFQTPEPARGEGGGARPPAAPRPRPRSMAVSQFAIFLRDSWPGGLLFIGGMAASMASEFLSGLYVSGWMVKQGVPFAVASTLNIAGLALGVAVSPFMGYAVDRFGVATASLAHGLIGTSLCVEQYWMCHKYPHHPVILAVWVGVSGLLGGMTNTIFLWLAGLFPEEVRGLAVSFYYNLGAVVGGCAPMISEWLIAAGHPLAPGYYTLAAFLLSSGALASSLWMHQNGGQPLRVAYIIDDPY